MDNVIGKFFSLMSFLTLLGTAIVAFMIGAENGPTWAYGSGAWRGVVSILLVTCCASTFLKFIGLQQAGAYSNEQTIYWLVSAITGMLAGFGYWMWNVAPLPRTADDHVIVWVAVFIAYAIGFSVWFGLKYIPLFWRPRETELPQITNSRH